MSQRVQKCLTLRKWRQAVHRKSQEPSRRPRVPPKAQLQQELGQKDEQLEKMLARVNQLEGQNSLLMQQASSNQFNANSGNDSEVVAILRQELERQKQETERQRQESKEQLEQQRQETERQRHESEEQLEQQRQENERQRQESKEQLEQQRQETERQRHELEEQREQQRLEMMREIDNFKNLLKQSMSALPKQK
ncbi:MAG: hypothetical protein M1826_002975 [Phylliscum demangeonii]|nr:MAG: hypothetical protein M1826_002975 [Phylliscum demangeonii]